ncbi:MAG: hypothetical protein ACR2MX_11580, partial [Cyclobacteriaceae bacterium]
MDRYRLIPVQTDIDENSVWIRIDTVGIDSVEFYDLLRFSKSGYVFQSFGKLTSLTTESYNDFDSGRVGIYTTENQTIKMEFWT